MHNLVLYCKTYKNDYQSFCRLLESIIRYNSDNIPFYVSVPTEDLALFSKHSAPNVTYITDESYMEQYQVKPRSSGLSKGYLDMEVCKLSFHETGFCKNYVCLDADCRFIRPFFIKDFMHDENTPYFLFGMRKDDLADWSVGAWYDEAFPVIKKVYDLIGVDDRRYRTALTMPILSCLVLKDFKDNFMKKNNYTYENLLDISPLEFTWYSVWFQKCELIKEYATEPLFKQFDTYLDYRFARIKGTTVGRWARTYVGFVFQSNWPKRGMPVPPKEYGNITILDRIFKKIISKLWFN